MYIMPVIGKAIAIINTEAGVHDLVSEHAFLYTHTINIPMEREVRDFLLAGKLGTASGVELPRLRFLLLGLAAGVSCSLLFITSID